MIAWILPLCFSGILFPSCMLHQFSLGACKRCHTQQQIPVKEMHGQAHKYYKSVCIGGLGKAPIKQQTRLRDFSSGLWKCILQVLTHTDSMCYQEEGGRKGRRWRGKKKFKKNSKGSGLSRDTPLSGLLAP